MNYQESLEYIGEIQKRLGSDYSLGPMRRLCELAGYPYRDLKIVHIAGTNGKGSVGTYVSNIMALSGYTVGRYVSPTLFHYQERIQRLTADDCDGQQLCSECIQEEEVADCLTRIREWVSQMEQEGMAVPTAFEIETVMAFLTMQRWNVDIAVIETGLGGRMDATNVTENPLLCLFSSIGLDHTAFLGDTLEEIAAQKYGIIKPGAAVVSVSQEKSCMRLLQTVCEEQKTTLTVADSAEILEPEYSVEGTKFLYRGEHYRLGQAGTFQPVNAITALEAVWRLKELGFSQINCRSIRQALEESRWKGRFEQVSKEPCVIVDGAHNPQAAGELRKSLECCFPNEKFHYIMGVFGDKDYEQILRSMLPLGESLSTVSPLGKRGLPAEVLAWKAEELLAETGMKMRIQSFRSVADALQGVKGRKDGSRTIVFGSLSFLHEVYEFFGK